MIRLWKRFTAWLHYLRHPCTIITMDEAPAKGVNVNLSYAGEYKGVLSFKDCVIKWGKIEGEMPDPNILADMLKGASEGKESKDWPWKPPFLLDYEEEQERLQEALDHVEECLDALHTGIMIGLHPQEVANGPVGLESQKKVVENVKENFKKLRDAIKALRKGQ